jgi:hypothetical protein
MAANSSSNPPAVFGAFDAYRPSLIFGGINLASNDLELIDIMAPGKVLNSMSTSTVFCRVVNSGSMAVNNVSVSLMSSGANVYSNTQVIQTLNPGTLQQINFTGFAPTINGINSLSVVINNSDNNLTNNKKVLTQSVTCSQLSYCPPFSNQSGSFGNQAPIIIASKHLITSSQTLAAVKLTIGTLSVNASQQMCAVLADQLGNVIATGATINISSGATMTFPFLTPQVLLPATEYFIGAAQLTPSCYPFSLSQPVSYVPLQYYEKYLAGTIFEEIYTYNKYFMMDAIFNNPIPIISVSNNTTICKGSSATLTVSSSNSYTWSNSSNSPSIIVSPATGTIYSVSSSNNVCMDTKTISVSVAQIPTLSIIGGTSFCVGSIGNFLQATGAQNYTWSAGSTSPMVVVNTSSYGVQNFSLIGQNSPCPIAVKTGSIIINALPIVSLTAQKLTYCSMANGGTTVQITGTPPGGSFTGSSINATGIFSPSAVGTASVQYNYTDPLTLCSNSDERNITVSDCVHLSVDTKTATLIVYPNPSPDGIFYIKNSDAALSAQVYDLLGANHKEIELKGSSVDLRSLPGGIYLLRILTTDENINVRLVKE